MLGTYQWQRDLTWKLVIALPHLSTNQQFTTLSDWLKSKFSVGSVPHRHADSQVSSL